MNVPDIENMTPEELLKKHRTAFARLVGYPRGERRNAAKEECEATGSQVLALMDLGLKAQDKIAEAQRGEAAAHEQTYQEGLKAQRIREALELVQKFLRTPDGEYLPVTHGELLKRVEAALEPRELQSKEQG